MDRINKKKQSMSAVFLIVLSFLISHAAFAAPAIDSTTGTFTHGASVIVSGSGFGTKVGAAPQLFDRVDNIWSLNNGDQIPLTGDIWHGDGTGNAAIYNTGNQRTSRSVASYYRSGTASEGDNRMRGFFLPQPGSQLFVSYWLKSSDDTTVGKYLRVALSAGSNEENNTFSWGKAGQYIFWNGGINCICDGCSPANGINWTPTAMNNNTWHFLEAMFDNTSNTWHTKIDNQTVLFTNANCDFNFDEVWQAGIEIPGSGTNTSNMDDIYVDNTFQRVAIGDASTYADSTHLELQPATAWADGSISFTLNQGAFAHGSQQYLYVVDSTNTANSDGFPITFGSGSADTTPPASPNGLSVS